MSLGPSILTKKILIITYYWPPAGGPGVQRWLKFVKYLPEYNIEPIVYCPENPSYPILDDSLVNEIPKGVTILKQPISEPYQFAKLFSKKKTTKISSGVIPDKKEQSLIEKIMLYIRGNYFIPDARKNWITPSVSYLSDYIKGNKIEVIITTGPPHSLHLIGLQLKQELKLKWFADFRDPWTTIGYHKALKLSKASKEKHKSLELQVLNTADEIIVTSNNTKQEFEAKTKQPITVITNGYDSHSIPIPVKDKNFTIAHIGSLLSERNPKILWEVLSDLIKENKDFKNDFKLKLIGVVSDSIVESINNHQLKDVTDIIGYVSHNDAIEAQMKAQVLILIEIDSEATKAIIPGKLFEYLHSKTPILAIGPDDSDVEQIIKKTNTGAYFNYRSKANLKQHILDLYAQFKEGTLKVNAIGIAPYSRKGLTKTLSQLLHGKSEY